jgi:hypothetical protein
MPKYKVWRDNGEEWDQNVIDPHKLIEARNQDEAAEIFADRYNEGMDNTVICIVQDEFGQYYQIDVAKEWRVRSRLNTTIEELRGQ